MITGGQLAGVGVGVASQGPHNARLRPVHAVSRPTVAPSRRRALKQPWPALVRSLGAGVYGARGHGRACCLVWYGQNGDLRRTNPIPFGFCIQWQVQLPGLGVVGTGRVVTGGPAGVSGVPTM